MKELQAHVSELTERRLELERGLAAAGRTNVALQEENDALAERFNEQAREVSELNRQLQAVAKEQEAGQLALEATARERDGLRVDLREARERANALAKEVVGLEQELLAAKAARIRAEHRLREAAESADASIAHRAVAATARAEAAEAAAAEAAHRAEAAEAAVGEAGSAVAATTARAETAEAAAADTARRAAAAEAEACSAMAAATARAEAAEAAAAAAAEADTAVRRAAAAGAGVGPGAAEVEAARAAAAAAEGEWRAVVARLAAALQHAEQLETQLAEAHAALQALQADVQARPPAPPSEHRPSTPSPPPTTPLALSSPTSSASSNHIPLPPPPTCEAGVQCVLPSSPPALAPIQTHPPTLSRPHYPPSPLASQPQSSPPTLRLSTPRVSDVPYVHRATTNIADRALSTAPQSPASNAATAAAAPIDRVLLSALATWLPGSGLEGQVAASGQQDEEGVVSEAGRAASAIMGLLAELEGELTGLRWQLAAKQVKARQLEVANEQLYARLHHQTQRLELLVQKTRSEEHTPSGATTTPPSSTAPPTAVSELPTTPSSAPPARKSSGEWGLAWFSSPQNRADHRIRTTLL